MGVASSCLHLLLTTSGHDPPEESDDGVLGDSLPDLDHPLLDGPDPPRICLLRPSVTLHQTGHRCCYSSFTLTTASLHSLTAVTCVSLLSSVRRARLQWWTCCGHNPSWDHRYGCVLLEELDYLCNLMELQVPPTATSRDEEQNPELESIKTMKWVNDLLTEECGHRERDSGTSGVTSNTNNKNTNTNEEVRTLLKGKRWEQVSADCLMNWLIILLQLNRTTRLF